jgi:hypothetical protein
VHMFCKLLIIRLFKSQIFLDTSVLRLIRFPQKVLMDFNLRWNYSPLKKRLPKLPGGLFVWEPVSQLSVLRENADLVVFRLRIEKRELREPVSAGIRITHKGRICAALDGEAMFCDQCGAQLQAGQSSCVRCGKPIVGLSQLRRNRVREHIRLLGILWMAYSALHVVAGAILIVVAHTIFAGTFHVPNGPPPEVTQWLRPFLSFIGYLILAKAAAGFIAGWGLLQRESWARVVALVVGFVALLNVPLGTALGIYTLWVLLTPQSDEEYKTLSVAA